MLVAGKVFVVSNIVPVAVPEAVFVVLSGGSTVYLGIVALGVFTDQ